MIVLKRNCQNLAVSHKCPTAALLSIFTDFANTLFPHELEYLMAVHNFSKPLNLKILEQIYSNNTSNGKLWKPFDDRVDKRTYSYLKNWITETLLKIDVDYFFDWLIETEKKILTDVIVPSDEAVILSNMNKMHPTNYNYIRFYELLQYYRDYLMVRSRTKHNKVVTDFLEVHFASQYFQTYRKEIFEHRWHLYFTTYLFALINAKKYDKVVSICKRYNLLLKEKQRIDLPDYLPIIENYYYLSEYMEGKIDKEKLISSIVKSVKPLMKNSYRSRRMLDMIDELGEFLYDEMRKVKAKLLE